MRVSTVLPVYTSFDVNIAKMLVRELFSDDKIRNNTRKIPVLTNRNTN